MLQPEAGDVQVVPVQFRTVSRRANVASPGDVFTVSNGSVSSAGGVFHEAKSNGAPGGK